MIYQRQKQIFLCSFTAIAFKTGKDNITTIAPGLFACKVISFPSPFYGGQQVKVFASVGHTVKSQTPRNSGAVWVENVTASEFTACVLEYGNGSNRTLEVNWLSFQASLRGSQSGTTSLNSWTTGTECTRIDFQQVSIALSICFQLDPSLNRFLAPSLPRFLILSFPHSLVPSLPCSLSGSLVPSYPRTLVKSLPRSLAPSFPCFPILFSRLSIAMFILYLFQRFSTPPNIFVTAGHQIPKRPQDAMALWVEELRVDNFKICLREAKIFDGPHKNIKVVSELDINLLSVDNS